MPRLKTLLVEILDDFAGTPANMQKPSGKLLVTTAPAATIVLGPKTTPAVTMLFMPIHE